MAKAPGSDFLCVSGNRGASSAFSQAVPSFTTAC
jgi:hypothetical protein